MPDQQRHVVRTPACDAEPAKRMPPVSRMTRAGSGICDEIQAIVRAWHPVPFAGNEGRPAGPFWRSDRVDGGPVLRRVVNKPISGLSACIRAQRILRFVVVCHSNAIAPTVPAGPPD